MQLRVLGPLEARVDGVALPLGAPKQQAVLALLAVSPGRVVPLADLVDELWPEQPPASAVDNVRSYAANLRRLFNSVESGRNRLVRRGTGYLLSAEVDELDLLAFEDEIRRARGALQWRDRDAAGRLFTAALARWHGDVLAGLKRGPLLDARCACIDAERLEVIEETAELHIAMGEPSRAVGPLREHVLVHPLREHAQALLIRSLHLAGDVAGALSVYAAARAALVDQLGIEPGAELQAVHRAVLRRDAAEGPLDAHQAVVPRELPAEPGCFIGRAEEADRLGEALVRHAGPAHRRPAVVVVHGEGGVGKSALAVRVAHRVSEHFPDGQLYLDLFGFSPGLQPISTAEALGRMLRGLGLSHHDAPQTDADAAALLRTLTSDRRLLFVLDNVRDARQLTPLLPASPTCAVLITSRGPLASLDADYRLGLDSLSTRHGVALLHRLTGSDMNLATATRIVDLCDHLPLAIRIAAGRLIGRPDLSPDEFVDRLADRQRRLDELELEGLAVRSSIRVAYDALAAGTSQPDRIAARTFRALGLLRVPTVRAGVVAAMLAEPDPSAARAALDRLVGAQLVEPAAGAHYGLHDLVRLVAAETAAEEETSRSAELSQRRAMSYYLAHLRSAVDLLRPGRLPFLGGPLDLVDDGSPNFATSQAAAAWVHEENSNLMAAADQASRMPGDGRRFTLWISYLTASVLYIAYEWWRLIELGRLVLETADRHHDTEMAAWGHLMVGRCEAELGNDKVALKHFDQAAAGFVQFNEYGTALTLIAYAILADLTGKPEEAVAHYSRCQEFARDRAFSSLEGTVCFNLANLHAALGHWELAKEGLEQAATIRAAQSDRRGVGAALMILATVHCRTGEISRARRQVDDALDCFRATGDRFRECNSLLVMSELELRSGGHADALRVAETVLSHARADGNRYAEAAAVRQIAKVHRATGDGAQARRRRAESDALFLRVTARRDPVLEALFVESEVEPSTAAR